MQHLVNRLGYTHTVAVECLPCSLVPGRCRCCFVQRTVGRGELRSYGCTEQSAGTTTLPPDAAYALQILFFLNLVSKRGIYILYHLSEGLAIAVNSLYATHRSWRNQSINSDHLSRPITNSPHLLFRILAYTTEFYTTLSGR